MGNLTPNNAVLSRFKFARQRHKTVRDSHCNLATLC